MNADQCTHQWITTGAGRECARCGAHLPGGWWGLRRLPCILLGTLLASCQVVTPSGYIGVVGGKGAVGRKADGTTMLVFNNDRSFQSATLAATAVAGLYYSAATAAAQEVTSQTALREATKQNASNNALKEALGAQELEKATFVPPP